MATQSHKVVKGDTLSEIAYKYYPEHKDEYASWKNYMSYLKDLNNIENENLIYVGQVIKLTGSKSTTSKSTSKPKIAHFGLQSNSDNTLFATWNWDKANTKEYKVEWKYHTGDGVWFIGNESTVTAKQSTYSMPSNATRVRFRVRPIAQTKTTNNKEVSLWTASWSDAEYFERKDLPLSKPAKPTLTLSIIRNTRTTTSTTKVEDYNPDTGEYLYRGYHTELTGSYVYDYDYNYAAETTFVTGEATTHIYFEFVDTTTGQKHYQRYGVSTPSPGMDANEARAQWSFRNKESGVYKVRCRAEVYKNSKVQRYSPWSDFSESVMASAVTPDGFIECHAQESPTDPDKKADVYLEWEHIDRAHDKTQVTNVAYKIEYTNSYKYFDSGAGTTVVDVTDVIITENKTCRRIIPGLDLGKEYYFRLSCKFGDSDYSPWSSISRLILGKQPAVPTTWSSTNTAIIGEDDMTLYWQHNSVDGSSQTSAQLKMSSSVMFNKCYKVTYSVDFGKPVYLETDELLTEIDSTYTKIEGVTTLTKKNDVYSFVDEYGEVVYFFIKDVEEDPGLEPTNIYTITTINDEIDSHVVDMTDFGDGHVVNWKVRTAGIYKEKQNDVLVPIYSEWSVERTFSAYSKPSISMDIVDKDGNSILAGSDYTIDSLPFCVKSEADTNIQNPVSYNVSIIANESYEITDAIGNVRNVYLGDTVYSKNFEANPENPNLLHVEFSAGDVALESDTGYSMSVTVYVDSGLSATTSVDFLVVWSETSYEPNAEIGIDENTYTAVIRPYCEYHPYYRVVYDASTGKYINTKEEIQQVDVGFVLGNKYTDTGEEVNFYISNEGAETYFCISNETSLAENVVLSVYRRYLDEFVEIAGYVENNGLSYITDPHPSLDYARYRIVATDKTTGSVSYYDMPDYPVNGKAIIIQWNESWIEYENVNDDVLSEPSWNGSMLVLPYNIDISNNYTKDVSLVSYIGRKHPVSYRGTQVGEKPTWNTKIPAYDTETLDGLRRLAVYQGNVYVREPSGTGYWADVLVSFTNNHNELVIPVTLSITRVEGGV